MKWFRFYSEFRSDPKMRRMPIAHRYAFIVLLCLANDNQDRGKISGLDDDDIAYELEMSTEDWLTLKAGLKAKGLIALEGSEITIVTWEYDQKHRDRLPVNEWRRLRELVFERDGYTCQYCGVYGVELQCDHVLPISRGGTNDPSNLVTACRKCNQSKHNKTPDEWLGGEA